MARYKINEESKECEEFLPPQQPDRSGVGVNYANEYLKKLNTRLEDGTAIACKRRGLRITVMVGDQKGQAVMNRLEHGPDPKVILSRALTTAIEEAGAGFFVEDGVMYLEMS